MEKNPGYCLSELMLEQYLVFFKCIFFRSFKIEK